MAPILYRGRVELAKASAVTSLGQGVYGADLDPAWAIGTKPNGGYLLAVLARAAVTEAGDLPHPAVVSAHFMAAPDPGPAELTVEVLRRGRTASQSRVSLSAGGRRCVEALVTTGRLRDPEPPYWSGVDPVAMPAWEACVPAPVDDPRFPVPLFGEIELRIDPATAGFAVDAPSMTAEIRGYARITPERPDPYALLMAADCLPPATFELGLTRSWVPTLELTVYVRALPVDGPLRVRQRARMVADSRVDEECDVWDAAGNLVATAHQLAALRLS
jgi:acyl-CoA thioesterase